ncbi:MAG: membrane protein insertase YidC [Verrucomicrobia bacterium]|nr:membrane protein insertase YidC [Verrucomicrobiota bacterium]
MINKIRPPKPLPPRDTNAIATAQSPAAPQTGATPASATASPAAISTTATRAPISTNTPEQLLVVTNENARYTFTSHGGGLKEIALVHYRETITRESKKNPITNGVASLNSQAHLPVLAVVGDENVQGDGVFTLTLTANVIHAEKNLANGLRVTKEFRLGTNYLIHASVRLENSSSNALTLPQQDWVVGTATPMGWDDDGSQVGMMWFDGAKKHDTTGPYFDNKTLGCFPGTPRAEYRDGASNVVWTATHNQFFFLAAMPDSPAQQVTVHRFDLPRPTKGRFKDEKNPSPKAYETVMVYPGATLAAGQAVERKFNIFAGPKDYRTLDRIGNSVMSKVDLVMGFDGFFGFFAKVLLLGMNGLHDFLRLPYGWAIIGITVIIKLIFWPLTALSTRSSQKMAALAPQLAALKEKYKDDQVKFQQKMSELYRENGVNPVTGCIPVLIQLPVFFGLFAMLRSAIELRGASFFWAVDLSKTDTLFTIPGLGFLPFIGTPDGLPLNLLPILYITTAIWQTHTTPMSPGMDPTQQKMMRWMPLMFLAILYNFSSGLALYMTVNNLLTILQTKMMKKNQPPASPAAPATASVLTPASKKKK